jgi:hypothetical protein
VSERIAGAPARGLYRRLAYWLTRKKVGKVAMPVQLHAHHGRLLFGMGLFEDSLARSRRVDRQLKDLASIRVSARVGCPF